MELISLIRIIALMAGLGWMIVDVSGGGIMDNQQAICRLREIPAMETGKSGL